jgi:AraC-like DNA-binding protein
MIFCLEGKCEIRISNGMSLFLNPGNLIFIRHCYTGFSLLESRYKGIELSICDFEINQDTQSIFKNFNIDLNWFFVNYCTNDKKFVTKVNKNIKSIFLMIWKSFYETDSNYFRIKIIELLYFLKQTEISAKYKMEKSVTIGQAEIAKKITEIIKKDLQKHYTIEELSKIFCISKTSLKNYFQLIHGRSMSDYLRESRMNKAAEYLENSNKQIADIAFLIGYENPSKFSGAFKTVKGETPLEYRRRHKRLMRGL